MRHLVKSLKMVVRMPTFHTEVLGFKHQLQPELQLPSQVGSVRQQVLLWVSGLLQLTQKTYTEVQVHSLRLDPATWAMCGVNTNSESALFPPLSKWVGGTQVH